MLRTSGGFYYITLFSEFIFLFLSLEKSEHMLPKGVNTQYLGSSAKQGAKI